jgi:hypothetical protein
MTEENATESTETDENVEVGVSTSETAEETPDAQSETFDRPYVENLRKESAGYRDRAKTAEARVDELTRALLTAQVAATGRLADPTDLKAATDVLDNPEALNAAIDALLEAKPHLKARKASGDIGQGSRGASAQPANLLSIIKGRV